MTDDRDPVVTKALRDITVPDHGPDFWSGLSARLATEPAPVADRRSGVMPAPVGASTTPAAEAEDEEEGRVVPLLPQRERRGRSTTWLASVAAVLVVVAAAVALVNRPEPEAERLRVAERSEEEPAATTSTTSPRDSVVTTVAASAGMATPDAAVVAWLEAVGAGDTARAARLTGPWSKRYVDSLTGGAGIEGFLTEAGEGFGAWADSPDRSTTEVDLDVEGQDITIVVVSGTWTGEGGTTFRTDAIPAVRTDAGTWLVEPWAGDPATGGRIVVSSPSPASEGGFNGLAPDEVLTASAPGDGTFHFSIDDQPPTTVRGQRSGGGGVRATFDPPQELASRTHLFVIAYVDGEVVSAVAGTFLVEG